MSSIVTETNNENQLTVEEYVRYLRIKEQIAQFFDVEVRQLLQDAENSLDGLTIDLNIKYSIEKKNLKPRS